MSDTLTEPADCSASAASPLSVEDRDALAVQHIPMVAHIVRETMARVPSYVDANDLRSAGMLALVNAARAFNPDLGVPFVRYANTRIRGAIVDELRATDWAPRSVRRRGREIGDTRAMLSTETGRCPDNAAVAQALGISVEEIAQADADVARASVGTLNIAGADGSSEASRLDHLTSPELGPEAALEHFERVQYVADAVEELPDRLAFVVRGYFLEERPMAELADVLGVSESRISQLRAEALVLMRDALTAALEPARRVPHANPKGAAARRRDEYAAAVATRYASRASALATMTIRRAREREREIVAV